MLIIPSISKRINNTTALIKYFMGSCNRKKSKSLFTE